jgi:hemoglobin-like flavoprotein
MNDLDAVTASYHRCRTSDGFIDTFYAHFLAKSSDVVEKFRHTDFARQKLMLRESLISMLLYNLGNASAGEDLERLAERHSRRGVDIPPRLYDLWLDALCEAVELHDPEFKPELTVEWRKAMRAGIELITSQY